MAAFDNWLLLIGNRDLELVNQPSYCEIRNLKSWKQEESENPLNVTHTIWGSNQVIVEDIYSNIMDNIDNLKYHKEMVILTAKNETFSDN